MIAAVENKPLTALQFAEIYYVLTFVFSLEKRGILSEGCRDVPFASIF
jgi:hypothetical protein